MSKKVIKPIVLIVVFIAALITFCITTNKGNKDMTTKQADATLPVMSFNLDKIKINPPWIYYRDGSDKDARLRYSNFG